MNEANYNKLEPTAEWTRIQQALKELETLKASLPTNADEDSVFIQDEIWMWDSTQKKPICGVVDTITEGEGTGEFEFMGILHEGIPFTSPDWCSYSSEESCRNANKEGARK